MSALDAELRPLWDEELHEIVHRLNVAIEIVLVEGGDRWNTPLAEAAGHLGQARSVAQHVAGELRRLCSDREAAP